MKLKWSIFSAIIVLWIFGIIGVAIKTYSGADPELVDPAFQTAQIVFIMLGGLGVILPTYLSIWNSVEASETRAEDIRLKKADNAFNLLKQWDNDSLLKARRLSREIKAGNDDLSPNDIIARIDEEPEMYESVVLLFNYFDHVRMSLKTDRVDKSMVREAIGETILDIVNRFNCWSQQQSRLHKDHLSELRRLIEHKTN